MEYLKSLKILGCFCNRKINDVNHLSGILEELNCGLSGIDQDGISQLKSLKKIDCWNNEKIKDVGHMDGTLEKMVCNNSIIRNNLPKKISQY